MLRATLGESLPVQIQASSGESALYARAKIYDIYGTNVSTIALPHIAGGLYGTTHIFSGAGYYTIVYQLFLDSGFSSPAEFDIEAETVEANSDKTNILRILGLTHDNTVLDNHVYNVEGNLTNVRVRSYDSKANALAAGAAGLENTWSISAVYSSSRLETYTVVRET
jgi:hypothetical protein